MDTALTVAFVAIVVAFWVYAGYRIVSVSERRYATVRYVAPLVILGIGLIVVAVWPKEGGSAADAFILTWILPVTVLLLAGAFFIDSRRRPQDG